MLPSYRQRWIAVKGNHGWTNERESQIRLMAAGIEVAPAADYVAISASGRYS